MVFIKINDKNYLCNNKGLLGESILEKEDTLNYISQREVEICLKWLKENTIKSSRISQISSYAYKHIVEEDQGEYVSNGAFILACSKAGYVVVYQDSLNARFRFKVVKK